MVTPLPLGPGRRVLDLPPPRRPGFHYAPAGAPGPRFPPDLTPRATPTWRRATRSSRCSAARLSCTADMRVSARRSRHHGELSLRVSEFRDLGDRVVAIGRFRTRGRKSGVEAESPIAYVVDIKDGKVIRSLRTREGRPPKAAPLDACPAGECQVLGRDQVHAWVLLIVFVVLLL